MITVDVPLGPRSYQVVVGDGARHQLALAVPGAATRAAIVTQGGIAVDVDPGIDHRTWTIGEGEEAKSLATVEWLCREWSRWGLTRRDVVIAVGGGVVTDTAGFAAAVYQRGVAVVHVATTLLAQVDAAIGGKTGVNLPEGKNLVGAFWQPAAVFCDTEVLRSLPPREYQSGCGEMAKYHFLGGADLASLALDEKVARCVEIKAAFVGADEHEDGRRALLNYGHTLAHALETVTGYDVRHGEAVAIGLVFAARLAQRLGRIDEARVVDHLRVVSSYDLAHELPRGIDHGELVDVMGRDKKAVRGLTFVLDGPDGVEVVAGIDADDVTDTLANMPVRVG
ncbi:MAG: 3-dehydroquinate synthase [Acidimicrobiales bacterium]